MHKLKNKNNNNKMIMDHDDNNSRFLSNNPSFSSTLLDQIYRSIDQGDTRSPEMRFYRETTTTTTTQKKQSNKQKTETTLLDNRRGENNKVNENYFVVVGTEKSSRRRRTRDELVDQDALFFNSFSSASFSSDSCSSSGGFSSSDTESFYGTRSSRASCFAPLRPKPVRTSMSFRSEEKGNPKFHSFRHDSNVELGTSIGDYDESALIKSKSRALKIYNNLKKVKQPISPGAKITSFLNSIFANSRKNRSTHEHATTTTKSYPTRSSRVFEQEHVVVSSKLAQTSTTNCCSSSSASSFSRSCLSKTNSSEREKLYNGVKRSVRFFPVSEVVGEDCDDKNSPMKNTIVEKSKVVKEVARDLLNEYRNNNNNNNNINNNINKNKSNLVLKDLNLAISNDDDDEDDEDTASCASSDLFELDHLAVFGSSRYSEELPVYETTHVDSNRAIANGFLV